MGILFGHLGDRHGRKLAPRWSILVMAVPTEAIGLLPTHAQLGTTAAALLVGLRLVQGIAVGGEIAGSASFLVEIAPSHRRGLTGSLSLSTAVAGILSGSAVVSLTSSNIGHQGMLDWGWRLPFLGGIAVLALAVWLRRNMTESLAPAGPLRTNRSTGERAPLVAALR